MINLNTSINLKKIKVNVFILLRCLYPAVLVLIVVFLSWMMYFLYQNVYQTLAEAEILTELRKKVPEETLQKDKFEGIIQKLKEKTGIMETTTSTPAGKDPFLPLER